MKTNISSPNSTRGVALVIVMVVVLVLTAIVAEFAVAMKVETRLAMNNNYDSELEWMGRGGVEWARWAVGQKSGPPIDALNQFWSKGYSTETNNANDIFQGYSLEHIDFGDGAEASVTIEDMERKWNINAIAGAGGRPPQPMIIQQALNNMGLTDQSLASTISDSIADWVSVTDTHHFNGAKNDYYLHLDPPYYCKEGYIDDISELLLIKGIHENPEIYYGKAPANLSFYDIHDPNVFRRGKERPTYAYGLKDVFTVMGSGHINVNTAGPMALQMIPGVDERAAQAIITARNGQDGQEAPFQNVGMINGANIPGLPYGPGATPFQNFCEVSSKYFDVTVHAKINGFERTYHAVICRIMRPGASPKDPQIVKFYWE